MESDCPPGGVVPGPLPHTAVLRAAVGRIFLNSKLLDAVTVFAVSGKTLRKKPEAVLVCLGAGPA